MEFLDSVTGLNKPRQACPAFVGRRPAAEYDQPKIEKPKRDFVSALALFLYLAFVSASSNADVLPQEMWQGYKERFVRPDGRVVDNGGHGVTTSESQAYGMLFAYYAGDKAAFQSIWDWAEEHLRVEQHVLYAWKWANGEITDYNNATDADLVIAWILQETNEHWGDGFFGHKASKRSSEILDVIEKHLFIPSAAGWLILPGFSGFIHGESVTVNLSYWVFPALNELGKSSANPVWGEVYRDGIRLLRRHRYLEFQLPADWISINGGNVSFNRRMPARFGYEAIRIPLYWMWAGEGMMEPVIHSVSNFLHGQKVAWVDLVNGERAMYPPGRGMTAVADLVRECPLGKEVPPSLANIDDIEDYYASSLVVMARIVWELRCL